MINNSLEIDFGRRYNFYLVSLTFIDECKDVCLQNGNCFFKLKTELFQKNVGI